MQIILLEKIANLGNLGDVVRVKDGFARNFLIPKRKARRATTEAIQEFEVRRAELEKIAAEKLAQAQALVQKMANLVLNITQKAGVDGRLFGSVTNLDVVHALAEQSIVIEKNQVRLPSGPLKILGEHTITIVLHTDVSADLKVLISEESA